MSKLILHIITSVFFVIAAYPQSNSNLTNQQRAFVDLLYPEILKVNTELMQQRTGIYRIYQAYLDDQQLTENDMSVLMDYFDFYKIDLNAGVEASAISREKIIRLLSRVDIIPPDYTLASAGIPSDWIANAKSMEGFALLNQTHSSGNTKSYGTLADALRDYAFMLNTDPAFSRYRDVRAAARINGETPQDREMIRSLIAEKPEYYYQILNVLSDIRIYLQLYKGDDDDK